MKPYICPKCSAVQKRSRMPWLKQDGVYIFRCQNCATMLTLDETRRFWAGFGSYFVLVNFMMIAISLGMWDITFIVCIVWVAVTIIIVLRIPAEVAVHTGK